MTAYLHSELTSAILNAFYHVSELGLDSWRRYTRMHSHRTARRGFHVVQQSPIPVWYHGLKVGEYL
jgi:hypothetical protein